MSVIIVAHVREGIVLASDTRTTVKDENGNTMYKDDVSKSFHFRTEWQLPIVAMLR